MKVLAVAVLLFLLAWSEGSHAREIDTGQDFIEFCEQLIQGHREKLQAVACLHYVKAAWESALVLPIFISDQKPAPHYICPPNIRFNDDQLAQIAVDFINKRPSFKTERAIFGVAKSLEDAFPCPTPQ